MVRFTWYREKNGYALHSASSLAFVAEVKRAKDGSCEYYLNPEYFEAKHCHRFKIDSINLGRAMIEAILSGWREYRFQDGAEFEEKDLLRVV